MRVTLVDGAELDEHTVTLDHELRRFQYRVLGGDLHVDSRLGTVDVINLGDGQSLLVHGTDIESETVAGAFDDAIKEAVRGLDAHLAPG